ncbi:MAG TPA: hypothetical protein VHV77_07020, partial [Pirellulales bacterium]|nr:hypothetical protein [Pirellulales bacterium]
REQKRYFVGNHYNELTQQYIKMLGRQPTIDSLLDDNSCDPRTIYDDLPSMQLTFQAAWCAMAMCAAAVVTLLGAAAQRERLDALLVRVKSRVDAWPKEMPADVTLKMRQAMDALTASSVPNTRGCISTLYSIFADDAGLLRKLFNVYRPGPEGDKAWKKFGNFIDQIENVNKLGLLRSDIYSDLHYVRCSENSGKHRGLEAFELAALTMNHAVRIVEWWAYQSKYGPHLPNPPRDLTDITDPRTDGPADI